MIKQVVIRSVSYKNKAVKIANSWYPIAKEVNLNQIETGKEHEIEVDQDLDKKWIVMKILKAPVRTYVKQDMPKV